MKAIGTLLLLILTITLCGVFYVVGFIYALIRAIKHRGLGVYYYWISFSLDQSGNTICQHLFNDILIKPYGHRFGNPDETISHVLGVNLIKKTLYPAGKVVVYTVDLFAYLFGDGKNHCQRAALNSQINK